MLPACMLYVPLVPTLERSRRVREGPAQTFATIRLRKTPIDGEAISTASPTFRKRSGNDLRLLSYLEESMAVPAPVPPATISPGNKVRSRDISAMSSANEYIMSLVEKDCRA